MPRRSYNLMFLRNGPLLQDSTESTRHLSGDGFPIQMPVVRKTQISLFKENRRSDCPDCWSKPLKADPDRSKCAAFPQGISPSHSTRQAKLQTNAISNGANAAQLYIVVPIGVEHALSSAIANSDK